MDLYYSHPEEIVDIMEEIVIPLSIRKVSENSPFLNFNKYKTDARNQSQSSCPGYYNVSGYINKSGKQVDDYIRRCYKHGK